MNVASFAATTVKNLQSSLEEIIQKQFQPTIAIAFCDPGFPFKEASALFYSQNIQLVGCTSSGEIRDEKIIAGSFSVLLMDINPQYFNVV